MYHYYKAQFEKAPCEIVKNKKYIKVFLLAATIRYFNATCTVRPLIVGHLSRVHLLLLHLLLPFLH